MSAQHGSGTAPRAGERRSATAAWAISAVFHLALLAAAGLFVLGDPVRDSEAVSLRFERRVEQEVVEEDRTERAPNSGRLTAPQRPLLSEPTPPENAVVLQDLVIEEPASDDGFIIPPSPIKSEMTPEEAFAELNRLLEEYPQYRDQVLREMIAGDGFVQDSLPPINLYLEQMFKGGVTPTWQGQRHVVEQAFSTFNGVSGWSQNGNYGGGVNVLGLLKLLIDLIEGE